MLTAKNRDQLLNHTLGNRVWATFLQSVVYSVFSLVLHLCCSNYAYVGDCAVAVSAAHFWNGLPSDVAIAYRLQTTAQHTALQPLI